MKLFYHIAAELSHDTASTLSRRAIHSTRKSTALRCCADESGRCCGTFHHFSMQPRQHIADPCIALKTGCPRMGVCRPSFFGSAGASFIRTKSSACRRTVSRPTRAMYARSAAVNSNRERNFDLPSRTNASAFVMPLFYHNSALRLQAARNAQDRFLPEFASLISEKVVFTQWRRGVGAHRPHNNLGIHLRMGSPLPSSRGTGLRSA